jgi:hypothetical protein
MGENVKRIHRSCIFPLLLLAILSGCAAGNVLTVPGGLSGKASPAPPGAAGAPEIAVLDFSWTEPPEGELGRDYVHARPIVWKGNAGKSMADLVAGALAEKGIAAIRAAGEADIPAGVPARVWGSVEEFRVDLRTSGMIHVKAEASTTIKIQGAGPGVPAGWSSSVSSTYGDTDLFTTPEGVQEVLNGAANAVAAEAVRRMEEAGVVSAPK